MNYTEDPSHNHTEQVDISWTTLGYDDKDTQHVFYSDIYDTSTGGEVITDVALRVFCTCAIAIVNVIVIVVVVRARPLRTSPKYIHVVNLCIADLLYALPVLPLLIDFRLQGGWIHSCGLRLFVNIYDTSFHPVFTFLALSMLNVIILFEICTSLFDRPFTRPFIATSLTVIPWVLTSLGILPLYNSVLDPQGQPSCPSMITPEGYVALLLLTYPVVCVFLIASLFLTTVLVLLRRNINLCGGKFPSRGDDRVPRGDPEDERTEFMLDILLVSFLTIGLTMPVYVVEMYYELKPDKYRCFIGPDCDIYAIATRLVYFLRLSRSFIIPLVWFLGKDFCYCCLQLFRCKPLLKTSD